MTAGTIMVREKDVQDKHLEIGKVPVVILMTHPGQTTSDNNTYMGIYTKHVASILCLHWLTPTNSNSQNTNYLMKISWTVMIIHLFITKSVSHINTYTRKSNKVQCMNNCSQQWQTIAEYVELVPSQCLCVCRQPCCTVLTCTYWQVSPMFVCICYTWTLGNSLLNFPADLSSQVWIHQRT